MTRNAIVDALGVLKPAESSTSPISSIPASSASGRFPP